MALINKISNIIRESIDLPSIINPTLKELAFMCGAFKAYYAEFNNKKFSITQSLNISDINSTVMFDNNVIKTLKNNKISYSRCMRENLNSEPLKESVQ